MDRIAPPATAADPRWSRIVRRDASADGAFWYSVATTGVYCRPSCPSRACNPANVSIHDTLADARATGRRACRRCRPDEPAGAAAALVARCCRLIEEADGVPALADLAQTAGLAPAGLRRVFRSHMGLTPAGYARARRAARVRDALVEGQDVTRALHGAGFGSSGRFYEAADGALGMAPSRYRAGGGGQRLVYAVGHSSLGQVLAASGDRGVAAILMGDDADALVRDLARRFPAATLEAGGPDHAAVLAAVVALVEEPAGAAALPLDVRGTAFQERVWQALRRIPAGTTLSYAQLADAVGLPGGSRAVASACAANRLAVAIPCHRIVRGDGALSGYAWGVERKRALLDRERRAAESASKKS